MQKKRVLREIVNILYLAGSLYTLRRYWQAFIRTTLLFTDATASIREYKICIIIWLALSFCLFRCSLISIQIRDGHSIGISACISRGVNAGYRGGNVDLRYVDICQSVGTLTVAAVLTSAMGVLMWDAVLTWDGMMIFAGVLRFSGNSTAAGTLMWNEVDEVLTFKFARAVAAESMVLTLTALSGLLPFMSTSIVGVN